MKRKLPEEFGRESYTFHQSASFNSIFISVLCPEEPLRLDKLQRGRGRGREREKDSEGQSASPCEPTS